MKKEAPYIAMVMMTIVTYVRCVLLATRKGAVTFQNEPAQRVALITIHNNSNTTSVINNIDIAVNSYTEVNSQRE